MRTKTFSAHTIKKFLRIKKIATMNELKTALGTKITMTVFRKLRELSYRTSYSHRGKYYTLDEILEFNDMGLWSFKSVWFSTFNTLIKTAKAFVNRSEAGYSTHELENILHTQVKEPLLYLYRRDQISRSKISARYVYFSIESKIEKAQRLRRNEQESDYVIKANGVSESEILDNELKASIILFFALLDEKQRRLYSGLESLKIGYGGDKKIADILGIDTHTVARGRSELLAKNFEQRMIRKKGGGNIPVEKKIHR